MIILKSSHLAVVKAKDEQIQWLYNEVNYFRSLLFGKMALPSVETVLTAPPQLVTPTQPAALGAHWSEEEWADYNNWCAMQVNMGIYGEPEFMRKLYTEQHGERSPSDVMQAE